MKQCPRCKKVLFKKKNGKLVCPNGCDENFSRAAFNTVIDPEFDRREGNSTFDPWAYSR